MVARALDSGWRIALCALAWLGGIAAQLQQAALWPAGHYGGLCGAALLLGYVGWRSRRGAAFVMLTLACAMAGTGLTGLRAHARLAQALDARLEGADLLLTGVVASLPQVGPSGTRFVFEVEAAQRAGQAPAVPGQTSQALDAAVFVSCAL